MTIGVSDFNAIESRSDISFRQIHKPSGRRVNYVKMVEGVGKIENSDIVKGYEVDKDTYVTLDQEEIEAVKIDSKKTIDLVEFVDARDIDYRYFERPYFLAPADDLAAEDYVVIRDALRKSGKVGLAQITVSGREWLVAVAPRRRPRDGDDPLCRRAAGPEGLLRHRSFAETEKEMVDLALKLIEQKTTRFDPKRFTDHYGKAPKDLVAEKMKGHKIVAPQEDRPGGGNVIDLMEALKRSLGSKVKPDAGGAAKGKGKAGGKKAAK